MEMMIRYEYFNSSSNCEWMVPETFELEDEDFEIERFPGYPEWLMAQQARARGE